MWNEKIELATEKMKASYRNWGNFGMSSAMTVKEEQKRKSEIKWQKEIQTS